MLSVCIPIYNRDVCGLVHTLYRQLIRQALPFELLLLDDGSAQALKAKNQALASLPEVKYMELPQNIGRAAIRNKLVQLAAYESLLFMDCDAQVVSDNYIANYLPFIGQPQIVYGGSCYQAQVPIIPFRLHWKYGKNREALPAQVRQSNPNLSFSSFNFIVPKKIIQQCGFETFLLKYGHEDTLFGFRLEKLGVEIQHINNPLRHDGLETDTIFLAKTRQGVENLLSIEQQMPDIFIKFGQTKLIRIYMLLQKLRLTAAFAIIYKAANKTIARLASGKNPKLWAMDLYKLGYYCLLKRSKTD
jgi:glycosyltransferase involved in cell wall biosynthesis